MLVCLDKIQYIYLIKVLLLVILLLDFSLTVKAATLIFIFGCGSAISSAKEGKSGFMYNFVKELISFLSRANERAFHENPKPYTH